MKKITQGVILAAGRGKRILPFSKNNPKPMLRVLTKPIIEYQIEAMKAVGVEEVFIVIGFLGEKIKKYFGDGKKFGLEIKYIVDDDPKGIASSLYKVKKRIKGTFLCFLGDIFVEPKGLLHSLLRMIGSEGTGNILLVRKELDIGILKLHAEAVTDKGRVIRLIEKPKQPKSGLRTCGIYFFTPEIFKAIEKTPASELRGEVELTDAVDKLISLRKNVYFEELKTWDINVTYEADLKKCGQLLKRDISF